MGIENYTVIIFGVIIILGLFLLLREFWCWFWKINEIKDLTITNGKKFDKMNQTLSEILNHSIKNSNIKSKADKIKCKNCSGIVNINDKFCEHCGNEVSN